jgi:hypothetical protein
MSQEGRIAALRSAFEGSGTLSPSVSPHKTPNGAQGATSSRESGASHSKGDEDASGDKLPAGGRPDTPQYGRPTAPQTAWDSTLENLAKAAVADTTTAQVQSNGKTAPNMKDRNLSGIVSATSKALKAALMENEELQARNAELEAKLVTGGAEDTDAGEIERALSDASLALAARRQARLYHSSIRRDY